MTRDKELVERVRQMERAFDTLQDVLLHEPDLLAGKASLRELRQSLIYYCESGQWLADYESDERGELPDGIKRGVLSEDGLYNLLHDVDRLLERGEESGSSGESGMKSKEREKKEKK